MSTAASVNVRFVFMMFSFLLERCRSVDFIRAFGYRALPDGRATAPAIEPSLTVGLLPRLSSPP
jgi:hypothetical protein